MAGSELLSAMKVANLSTPGKYSDGRGLYLQITKQGVKSWIFRYERNGVRRYMGLGPVYRVSLAQAREEARKARLLFQQGIDPLEDKAEKEALSRAVQASNKTFMECVADYIEGHKDAWRSEKHCKQWEATLLEYACPHFGKLNVRLIGTPHVLAALEPIWKKKTETASRLRERIERVLSWAATRGYRDGENPARWHGHLQELLPHPSKIKKVQHHPSLPYQEMREFYLALQSERGVAARALQFAILTASRTGEVLFAQWKEIDLEAQIWVIPPERMKAGKEHRIPLTEEALELLKLFLGMDATWVFPGAKKASPLSNMAMLNVLKKMQRSDLTVHGFRSTFRVWAAERTDYKKEIAELALAHSVGSAVEEAYQRSDLFERRRALMHDWAKWCHPLDDGTCASQSRLTSPVGPTLRKNVSPPNQATLRSTLRGDREAVELPETL